MATTITKERLAELLAKARANNPKLERRHKEITDAGYSPKRMTDQIASDNQTARDELSSYSSTNDSPNTITTEITDAINTLTNNSEISGVDRSTGKSISYNEKQLQFVQLASSGESGVLIGAAGSGKTTCMRGVMQELITSGKAGLLESDGHKYLRDKTPGIVIVSFTRRAVSNIRKAVAEDMKHNCLTIHALLEYEPVYNEIFDAATGEYRKTMSFEPTRHADRPLSNTIRTCVIEEASMVSVELFQELKDALPYNCQFIFLGDIQQLPPVFGAAILGYKMLELPVIELTEIYRQALESPIIRLAHRILSGKPIPSNEYTEWKYTNQLTLHPWKKKLDADLALRTIAKFLTTAIDNNLYNPEEDMVLIPFNKACGTIELNKYIAQHMARKRNVPVWEIIGGFEKSYLSVGDKVLYDKEDAIVTKILPNPAYDGAMPQPESIHLDYWGTNQANGGTGEHHLNSDADSGDDIDFLLAQSVKGGTGEDRVRQSSHEITLRLLENDREITLNTAGQLNALILSFALTVHKSQGSEFRKVFLMLHQSHATMLSRELLYTAVTRAKEELYVICEPESFTKGINSQRIKGNTLAEKAEYFKGAIERKGISLS